MTTACRDIRLPCRLLVVVVLAMGSSASFAEDIPREQHARGRFAPGSWTRIRMTLETIGKNGQKILRSELVTTRLQKIDQHGVTLQRETVGVEKNDVPKKQKPLILNWDGTTLQILESFARRPRRLISPPYSFFMIPSRA